MIFAPDPIFAQVWADQLHRLLISPKSAFSLGDQFIVAAALHSSLLLLHNPSVNHVVVSCEILRVRFCKHLHIPNISIRQVEDEKPLQKICKSFQRFTNGSKLVRLRLHLCALASGDFAGFGTLA